MSSPVKPVTTEDKKLSKKHIKATEKLVKEKIKDHAKAMKKAAKSGVKASVSYNKAHMIKHQQELKRVNPYK